MTDDVLRQAPLFSGLDEDSAAALETSMATSSLKRGDVLFNEGDDGSQLYVVTEGKVKLGRTSADGRENLLAILGPGQMFGELSSPWRCPWARRRTRRTGTPSHTRWCS